MRVIELQQFEAQTVSGIPMSWFHDIDRAYDGWVARRRKNNRRIAAHLNFRQQINTEAIAGRARSDAIASRKNLQPDQTSRL